MAALSFETRDVYYRRDLILQIESNCTESEIDYSFDYGSNWWGMIDDDDSQFSFITRRHENRTVSRLTFRLATIPLDYFSVRFRWRFPPSCHQHSLQYVSLGDRCPMNCYGHSRCDRGQCQAAQPAVPLVSSTNPLCSSVLEQVSSLDRLTFVRHSISTRWTRLGYSSIHIDSTGIASCGPLSIDRPSLDRSIYGPYGTADFTALSLETSTSLSTAS